MKLTKVLCVGPDGSTHKIPAKGSRGLMVKPHSPGIISVHDLSMTPDLSNPSAPTPRCVASVPSSWAFFYEWE